MITELQHVWRSRLGQYILSLIHSVCGTDPIGANLLRQACERRHLTLSGEYHDDVQRCHEWLRRYEPN